MESAAVEGELPFFLHVDHSGRHHSYGTDKSGPGRVLGAGSSSCQ
jgi:hypothetical protein